MPTPVSGTYATRFAMGPSDAFTVDLRAPNLAGKAFACKSEVAAGTGAIEWAVAGSDGNFVASLPRSQIVYVRGQAVNASGNFRADAWIEFETT